MLFSVLWSVLYKFHFCLLFLILFLDSPMGNIVIYACLSCTTEILGLHFGVIQKKSIKKLIKL